MLTGLELVVRHLIVKKSPVLGLSSLSAEVLTIRGLLQLYHTKGNETPFIKFIETTDALGFSPGTFPNLYAATRGVASVIDPNMGNYSTITSLNASKFFLIEVQIGRQKVATVAWD